MRYRAPPMPNGGLTLAISQSGETAETHGALQFARQQGQRTLSIVNVAESAIARDSEAVLQTLAGPEIGVASTKAFTTQLTVLAALSIAIGRASGHDRPGDRSAPDRRADRGAGARREVLNHDGHIQEIGQWVAEARDVLYLGRGSLYPIALEGALKLKEISYIHAEGYAAGEMKHGPIALIDEHVPVICIAPNNPLFPKMASNVQEVIARGGRVILISDKERASNAPALARNTPSNCPKWTPSSPRCSTRFPSNCSPTTPPSSRAPTWISRGTWRSR